MGGGRVLDHEGRQRCEAAKACSESDGHRAGALGGKADRDARNHSEVSGRKGGEETAEHARFPFRLGIASLDNYPHIA